MSLLLSPQKAGDYLGIGRTKLLALAAAGRIEVKTLDGRHYFTTQSLERFAASLPSANDNAPDKLGETPLRSVNARRGKRRTGKT